MLLKPLWQNGAWPHWHRASECHAGEGERGLDRPASDWDDFLSARLDFTLARKIRTWASLVVALLIPWSGATAAPYETGPWRLGMTRAQVASFAEYGPYENVAATGGLEVRNAQLNGRKSGVSFVFENDRLDFIQIWKYEGKDFREAKQAVLDVFDEMTEKFGGASVLHLDIKGPQGHDRDALSFFLDKTLSTAPALSDKWQKEKGVVATFRFDLVPASQPEGTRLHARFMYAGRFHVFYVFLFQDRSDAPERAVESNIALEKF